MKIEYFGREGRRNEGQKYVGGRYVIIHVLRIDGKHHEVQASTKEQAIEKAIRSQQTILNG